MTSQSWWTGRRATQIWRRIALMAPWQRIREICDGRRWRFQRMLWIFLILVFGQVFLTFISLGNLSSDSNAPGSSTSVNGKGCSGQKGVSRVTPSLALVVPTHDGDVDRAFVAMKSWPSTCYETTLHHVDLIVYHATDLDKAGLLARVPRAASACFRTTKILTSNLTKQEDVYPIGPSIQFYQLFLHPELAGSMRAYEAIAILEWDVVVAHESSFHRLYESAFNNVEPFWVKGSVLAGAEFHQTVVLSDMWFILGHINGNAIYDNSDPDFKAFVSYTRERWNYTYPYDVALWASLSEFPYSWPLWQRYSHKFVVSNLISNIGFRNVDPTVVANSITSNTLFIHGRRDGGGGIMVASDEKEEAKTGSLRHALVGCTEACGYNGEEDKSGELSTSVCDPTCLGDGEGAGNRFGNHLCGAGDPSRFGSACRSCYTDQVAALEADRLLRENPDPDGRERHVIMCDTLRPPEELICSAECNHDHYTICDSRCGSGHFGDLHCNWRRMGQYCRLCFNGLEAAQLADALAMPRGKRVIMCDTHEPPEPLKSEAPEAKSKDASDPDVDEAEASWDELRRLPFTKDVSRGQLCVFLPGYFDFFDETMVAVSSIRHFMPGVPIVITTIPMDFHVYHRTLGHFEGVNIVNATEVDISPLIADQLCPEGTQLIYYLSPGQVLSRSFSTKDTHMLTGQLVVTFAEIDRVDRGHLLRSLATTSLLEYHAPSFTYGTDLILPSDTNFHLRQVILESAMAAAAEDEGLARRIQDMNDLDAIRAFIRSSIDAQGLRQNLYIPEVLAALAFQDNQEGLAFIDTVKWSQQNVFRNVSVWDVPLIKPPFSCLVDMEPSLLGYDVASWLSEWFQAFRRGAKCERGFLPVSVTELKPKAYLEHGDVVAKPMPDIEDYSISLMYRTFHGDVDLFNVSLPRVCEFFPSAREVVVVVSDFDEDLFREILDAHQESSPFPIRLVVEPSLMDEHIQQKYSKLRADLYCEGDYILHLDPDSVLYEKITYDHIFHMGKPVLPFRRYREEEYHGKQLSWCWRNGTSLALGEDVVHEFSIFNNHVYPRKMYKALRTFVKQRHGKSFTEFMSSRLGMCMSHELLSKWSLEDRGRLLSDFNLMGAYLWYHMHDEVHWMATDPLDQTPGEWRRDIIQYSWACKGDGLLIPEHQEGKEEYISMLLNVTTFDECLSFTESTRYMRYEYTTV